MSVASDDVDIGMTHAIRGENHISNTPKQVAPTRAFGLEPPRGRAPSPSSSGWTSVALQAPRTVSVMTYRDEGILPSPFQLSRPARRKPRGGACTHDRLKSCTVSDFHRAQELRFGLRPGERLAFTNAKVIGETPSVRELKMLVRPLSRRRSTQRGRPRHKCPCESSEAAVRVVGYAGQADMRELRPRSSPPCRRTSLTTRRARRRRARIPRPGCPGLSCAPARDAERRGVDPPSWRRSSAPTPRRAW